jgi:hypothetical protein
MLSPMHTTFIGSPFSSRPAVLGVCVPSWLNEKHGRERNAVPAQTSTLTRSIAMAFPLDVATGL